MISAPQIAPSAHRAAKEKGSARTDELPLCSVEPERTFMRSGAWYTATYIQPTGLPTEGIDSPKPPEKSSQPRVAHLWQKSALRTK